MKKLLLFLMSCLLGSVSFSQSYHIYDSCHFVNTCPYIEMDTSQQNIWQIGPPSKPFFDTAYSFSKAIMTDTINPYSNANQSFFDIVLEPNQHGGQVFTLEFRHKYQTDTLVDGGYIEVSYDNGNSWTNVLYDDTVNLGQGQLIWTQNLYGENDTLMNDIHGFSGTSDGWIHTIIYWEWNVPIKNNTPDTLKIRFNFISDTIQTNKDGWMIDYIELRAPKLSTIEELQYSEKNQIKIYPNPLEEISIVKFHNPLNESMNLKIYNISGKEVSTIPRITSDQIEIKKDDLPAGVYLLKIDDSKGNVQTGRLLVK